MPAADHPPTIQEIILSSRLLELLHEGLKENPACEPALLEHLLRYTNAYLHFHELGAEQVVDHYSAYIKDYNRDVKNFIREGTYPLEQDAERAQPAPEAYNIILLLSTLLTTHRFRIMQLIAEKSIAMEHALFIGCGPGLEIELVKQQVRTLTAYDLSIDPFLQQAHPTVDLQQAFFDGSGDARYDGIYLIEILEHLSDPFELLAACRKVMTPEGHLHLTTATNLPQFDHRYNFESDHQAFEARVGEMGFTIRFKEDIEHIYMTTDIGAKNRYYVLAGG
ncbi:MAG: 2-polyprenyl-3-methyl-5-hydroxy-6-metoxy-1,4-benzoquinol methylase [Verrucomicrobiales bacterium]|jgi:2-polyprenyl-3-methyl-5-hydroxy-6-metoxy-1,4-benzoquinol methylase